MWAVALVVHFRAQAAGPGSPLSSSLVGAAAWTVAGVAALVMLTMWTGALVRLGRLESWGWFVLMLVLQLAWLGIVPMVAYAAGGPAGEPEVTRPSVT